MSEPSSPGTEAVATNGQRASGSGQDQDSAAGQAAPPDPWFEPVPHTEGTSGDNGPPGDGGAYTGEVSDDTGWFLRTGRAGLLPDSMTESWEESGQPAGRADTAGAPPWAGDQAQQGPHEPPPWESGPWPGPGEDRPQLAPAGTPAAPGPVSPAAADTGNWQATAAVGASILPIVLPGLALGVVGLRRSRVTGTGRTASWAAIALSLVWAVILIVWVASSGGTAAGACGGYENAVSIQVSQVSRDLSTGAPQPVVNADLRQAITQANSAAAQAQQVTARNAMATLTASLLQVAADASASDAAKRQRVAAAEAAMAQACKA